MNELLLYDLFEAVKKDKRLTPIGNQQYFFLLELFQKGYTVNSYNELLFVCEALWLKSKEQQPFIREVFNGFKDRIEIAFADAVRKENTGETEVVTPSKPDAIKPVPGAGTTIPGTGVKPAASADAAKAGGDQIKKEKPEAVGLASGEMRFSLGTGGGTQSLNIKLNEGRETESHLNIPYLFNDDYFPLSNRQLNQYWRNLTSRNPGRELFDIDFPSTIQRIGRQGFLDRLMFNRALQNQLSLIIFLDQGGSMHCYEDYGKELVKSAKDSKVHPSLQSAFFYNVPIKNKWDHYQLWSSDQTKAYKTDSLFRGKNKKDTVVIIYSDAGATKGHYNEERVKDTQAFIKYLQQQVAYVSWINPMPKRRWHGTSAEAISEMIPMFETGRQGMTNAVAVLRGSSI